MKKNKRNKVKHVRQGDVLVLEAKELDSSKLKSADKVTLALGEATGHHHSIHGGVATAELDDTGLADAFEIDQGGAELTHQEHATISLAKGKYRKVIQSEFVGNQLKKVVD